MNIEEKQVESFKFDIRAIVSAVVKKLWLIIIISVIAGIASLAVTYFFITPQYETSFTVYVNNKSENAQGNDSLTMQDVNASKSLASTYAQIITGRNVLTAAAENCNLVGSYGTIKKLVSVSTTSDTEIITVKVRGDSPEHALSLANAIIDTATIQISSTIDGSSMSVIDRPYAPSSPCSPSYIKNTLLAFIIAFIIITLIIMIKAFINDTITSEMELEKNYGLTILGSIPDVTDAKKNESTYGTYATYSLAKTQKGGKSND